MLTVWCCRVYPAVSVSTASPVWWHCNIFAVDGMFRATIKNKSGLPTTRATLFWAILSFQHWLPFSFHWHGVVKNNEFIVFILIIFKLFIVAWCCWHSWFFYKLYQKLRLGAGLLQALCCDAGGNAPSWLDMAAKYSVPGSRLLSAPPRALS